MEDSNMKKKLKSEEGQAIVEFALVLPLLLTILCGIIDFGWLFYNQLNIDNCAREASRQISVSCVNKTVAEVQEEAELSVKSRMMSKNTLSDPDGVVVAFLDENGVEITGANANLNAQMVKVSVKADLPVLTFVLQAFTRGPTKPINASATYKVETRATTVTETN